MILEPVECGKMFGRRGEKTCGRPDWHCGWHSESPLMSDMRPRRLVGYLTLAGYVSMRKP